jgi:hypothetical protein
MASVVGMTMNEAGAVYMGGKWQVSRLCCVVSRIRGKTTFFLRKGLALHANQRYHVPHNERGGTI